MIRFAIFDLTVSTHLTTSGNLMLQAKSEITGKTNIVLIVHFPIQTFVQMQLFFASATLTLH